MHNALRHKHVDFARRLFFDHSVQGLQFAAFLVAQDDAASLLLSLSFVGGIDFEMLCRYTALRMSADCLRVLLDNGAPWVANCLLDAAEFNRLGVLEVALGHTKEWFPTLPGVAASAGNVRFLMRIFEAGCPVWTSACDGTPWKFSCRAFIPHGEKAQINMEAWTLVVSPDLVRSGLVLLYAAQKGARLTPRMHGMLGEVRGRALALAGSFHVAARHSREPGAHARKWAAMGRVPVELVQNIATLAKISIVVRELVA
jgi:hypothetical protein